MTKLEAMARAICRATAIDTGYPSSRLDANVNETWRDFLPEARSALEALKDEAEPARTDAERYALVEAGPSWNEQIDAILIEPVSS
jgi:hypothetical protein